MTGHTAVELGLEIHTAEYPILSHHQTSRLGIESSLVVIDAVIGDTFFSDRDQCRRLSMLREATVCQGRCEDQPVEDLLSEERDEVQSLLSVVFISLRFSVITCMLNIPRSPNCSMNNFEQNYCRLSSRPI